MIVLDTNVASEAMKPDPDPAVRAWLNEQVTETLYLSGFSVASRDTAPFEAAKIDVINPWRG